MKNENEKNKLLVITWKAIYFKPMSEWMKKKIPNNNNLNGK